MIIVICTVTMCNKSYIILYRQIKCKNKHNIIAVLQLKTIIISSYAIEIILLYAFI